MVDVSLTVDDLTPFRSGIDREKAAAMIADAMAMARLVAPCLATGSAVVLTEDQAAAAKAIIRSAVLRWDQSGDAGLAQRQQTIGPASIGESFDNRQTRKGMFWPSEIEQLQEVCRLASNTAVSGAFAVDTVAASGVHAPWCALYFGGTYCSCGANLTNYEYPLFEGGDLTP